MRATYFFLPDYPGWSTGGHKYHTILFEYFKKHSANVFSFGHGRYAKKIETNKFLKIVFGIIYAAQIPRKSIVIHSNTSFLHCFIPMLFNKIFKRHFYFLIVHHLVRDEKPSFLRMKLEDYFIKNADKVVTVSATTQKKLYDLNLGLKDIKIFPPGLDVNPLPLNIKKQFTDKIKLLFVGTIEKRKGLIYLIEALGKRDLKNFELNIIGEPAHSVEYFELVTKRIKELNLNGKVHFLGKVSNEQLKNYYITSTAFVFPSLWEGYGMVIAEAMAYGLPVIASKIPAMEELIEDGKNGLFFTSENADDLKEKLKNLLTNKELLEYLSEEAKKSAQTFPNWESISKSIFEEVNQC